MYLRESAAKALGMLGDIRAIEPLANILENRNGLFDKFTFLKERIVETLGRLGQYGDEKSLRALKNALDDDAACIRLGAIEALSEMDDERVIPLIEKMIDDEDEDVARTAIFTLYEIAGIEYIKEIEERRELPECCKDEIADFLEEESIEGYSKKIQEICGLNKEYLQKKGELAKEFILKEKNCFAQAKRIFKLVENN